MRQKILLNKLSYMWYCNFCGWSLLDELCPSSLHSPDEKLRLFLMLATVATGSPGTRRKGLTRKFHKRITDFSTSYARFQKGLWIEFCNAQWSFSGSNGLYPTFFFYIINEAGKCKRRQFIWLIYFCIDCIDCKHILLDSAITYNEEEVDFPASWKIMLLQKEANSSLFSSWMSVILISFCGAPHPSKQE